jgi:hypothetical protein
MIGPPLADQRLTTWIELIRRLKGYKMPDLVITFAGMTLFGHGTRGEAWLVDTDKVVVGQHKHQHNIRYDLVNHKELKGGQLVAFEDNGQRLKGALDFSGVKRLMVDLDTLMPSAPVLDPRLAEPNPQPGGPWTELLSAWIRLPGGQVSAEALPVDTWPFDKDATRNLAEHFTITVPNVQAPKLIIAPPTGPVETIVIQKSLGKFRVHVTTIFAGTPTTIPNIGDTFKLEEVELLYRCLTNGSSGDVPERPFTQEDKDALPRQSNDVSICPFGCLAF